MTTGTKTVRTVCPAHCGIDACGILAHVAGDRVVKVEPADFPDQRYRRICLRGLSYYKYDLSLSTYCSGMMGTILAAIAKAWQGELWDDVEILSGKMMKPAPGRRKTILFGKCMYQANKDNPDIQEMIAIKGCPPKPKSIYQALHKAGIEVDPAIFEHMDLAPGKLLKRYAGKPEFDESFFKIN